MNLGLPEILMILLVVLILFGAGKLPKVMEDMGKGMKAFKKGMNDQDAANLNAEADVTNAKKAKPSSSADIDNQN